MRVVARHLLLLVVFASIARPAAAQGAARDRHPEVTGAVTLTNKGISLIPTFTLGKPAAIADLGIRKGDLSFEPQFRFGLDGKPWSFIFWWRYDAVKGRKFHLRAGAHPAVAFRTISVVTNGNPSEVSAATRYLAGELSPSYSLARSLSVGGYYLYGRAMDSGVVTHTHFLAARANVTSIPITRGYVLQFAPQLYYLWMDGRTGVYANAGLTLANLKLPFSVSATVNRPVRTGIAGGESFLWNVSLNLFMK